MKSSSHPDCRVRKSVGILSFILIAAVFGSIFAAELESGSNEAKNPARNNVGAQIECTTPDGRVKEIGTASDGNEGAPAIMMDDGTLSCALQEGQTTFIVRQPTDCLLDRFILVNENATAAGELKISVSNEQLPAASGKWVEVDGHISFANKRLFNLSLVGVEARYVKLAFHVRKAEQTVALPLRDKEEASGAAGNTGVRASDDQFPGF